MDFLREFIAIREEESETIRHLCELANVKKSRTTPYHPMGYGQVERFYQTLLNKLGPLEPGQKADWKKVCLCSHSCL